MHDFNVQLRDGWILNQMINVDVQFWRTSWEIGASLWPFTDHYLHNRNLHIRNFQQMIQNIFSRKRRFEFDLNIERKKLLLIFIAFRAVRCPTVPALALRVQRRSTSSDRRSTRTPKKLFDFIHFSINFQCKKKWIKITHNFALLLLINFIN